MRLFRPLARPSHSRPPRCKSNIYGHFQYLRPTTTTPSCVREPASSSMMLLGSTSVSDPLSSNVDQIGGSSTQQNHGGRGIDDGHNNPEEPSKAEATKPHDADDLSISTDDEALRSDFSSRNSDKTRHLVNINVESEQLLSFRINGDVKMLRMPQQRQQFHPNDSSDQGPLLTVAPSGGESCPKHNRNSSLATPCYDSWNERDMLSQVNISGLRAATDENREKSRRIVWVFLLTVCFAVMVIQITDRVRHFLSEPVSVQVTVARNNSLMYPAITICNKNKFNMSAMWELRNRSRHHHRIFNENTEEDIASLLALPNMDAHKIWALTAHSKEAMIRECWFGRNVTCDDRGQWRVTLTTMGVCHTYILNDSMVHLAGIFHNMYLKLEESENDHYHDDNGWKFYIHDVNEIPVLGVTTHGTSLYPGQGRDLRLDMKKIHALHHSKNPCEKNLSYLQNNCFFDCFMTRLAQENITCILPYMTGINLPNCSEPNSYRHTEKVSENLFFYGQWNPNDCNCRQQCMKILFTSSLESTTDRYKIQNGRTKARVRVYYQSLEYEFIREDLGYGTIDLLCDVGGTLSLLMGASLLTCCELLEVAWIMVAKKCCRKLSKSMKAGAAGGKGDQKTDKKHKQLKQIPAVMAADLTSTKLQSQV